MLFGLVLDVFLISLNKLLGISLPSIINFPLNILCLQCSELTCENPKISESVSFLPISFETLSK